VSRNSAVFNTVLPFTTQSCLAEGHKNKHHAELMLVVTF